ncbi:hypothetical protein LB504_010044 [Fusarium proliferatum]|nr:hypothetical protein LB504_010044 [Fusarium proliferatum]
MPSIYSLHYISAASLYAIITLTLWHFINYQLHTLARILSAPLTATIWGKIGLNIARSREQQGFSFFPKDISKHLIDQVISLTISKDIRTQKQAKDVLRILLQLLIYSYKEVAYLALFPVKGRKNRVPDIDVFEFTLAGTLTDSNISRRYLESQHFHVEAKRAIKAFKQLSRSPITVLYFPNPNKINGVISVTAKNGSYTVLYIYIVKPYITIPNNAKLTDTVTAIMLNQDLNTHP